MFTTSDTDPIDYILQRADEDARKLGLGHYLVLVRRGNNIVPVASEEEFQPNDFYIGVTPDVKAG
jgi:hypothetical protein